MEVFVERCLNAIHPGIEQELRVLREKKREWNLSNSKKNVELVDGFGGPSTVLCPWDMPFLMNRLKVERFEETASKLR